MREISQAPEKKFPTEPAEYCQLFLLLLKVTLLGPPIPGPLPSAPRAFQNFVAANKKSHGTPVKK
jgi:hypothetical protein